MTSKQPHGCQRRLWCAAPLLNACHAPTRTDASAVVTGGTIVRVLLQHARMRQHRRRVANSKPQQDAATSPKC
jgi:hypothetical protein